VTRSSRPVRFRKYQALGNDYLVIAAADLPSPSAALVQRITHRNLGIGGDGILVGEAAGERRFALRIYNPDGSEAEKSGNGLRIYARSLFDAGEVGDEPFAVATPGGEVRCQVKDGGARVRVAMGRVVFDSASIPVAGPAREVLRESLRLGDRELEFCAASVGNPHCVLHVDEPSEAMARELGPLLEVHPLFPNRTNVQFARVEDSRTLRVEIWERGAGYTLASGTSACAAAAVSRRLGLCEDRLSVRMPGGILDVELGSDFEATIEGPVVMVAEGELAEEGLERG
jgi:diaminopimelate epimerase